MINDQQSTETTHLWEDQPGGRTPRCARCKVVTFDAPWEFVVTWNPESGALPYPILHYLFRHRSTVEPGRAVHQTDKGHATHYERAVRQWLTKYQPGRTDVAPAASEVPCPPEKRA